MKRFNIIDKRIPVEIATINNSTKNHGITCKLKSNSDFKKLEAILPGPNNSPYENGKFKLNIEITEDYPFSPPIVKFITPVYHPNIDNAGRICLDVLQMPPNSLYSPAQTLESILISIQLLLATPNPDDPLRIDIANLYTNNRELYNNTARKYTNKYAIETSSENISTTSKSE